MKIKKCIGMLAVMTVISACGNNEVTSEEQAHESHTQESEQATVAEGPVFEDTRIGAIYPHYEKLSEYLVSEDVASAKKAALAIEEGAKKMNNSSLESTAAKIVSSGDVEEQRALFKSLSEELISEIKNSGTNQGAVFIAYCPMAFNDAGGEWLTSSEEIRNPYYGESMLNCGSIKETL